MSSHDLVVVGGGTGGLVAAQIAAGIGARVALVEERRTGGECLWTGCVPSKALIAAAGLAHRMRHADAVGLGAVEPDVEFARVMAHVVRAQETIAPQDSPERMRRQGVEVVDGHARFEGPRALRVEGRRLTFGRAIVATGSEPVVPPVPGLAKARPLTNETVWELRESPRRLVVLGGGAIGCELGQAFARLGSTVTIVEAEERLLPREETSASDLLHARLSAEGIDVRTGTRATEVSGRRLAVESAGRRSEVEFDRILVATGRRAATERLALDAAGVETDERGSVVVDARLRSSARSIWAVGDVTGALPFTHVAAYHARVAVPNALFGLRRRVDYRAVPWVTFTDPEIARVGMTRADAHARWGDRVQVTEFDYGDLDRAITAGEAYGFVKLVGDARGRLVGATVAAPAAGEAVAELAAWIAAGGRIDRVSQTVHAYPTFAEGPARAADEHRRRRLLNPRTRRLARPVLMAARVLHRVA